MSGKHRIVAVDFDGTLARTRFPEIIEPITENIKYCKKLKMDGAVLILWTCRCGQDLQDAVEWCAGQGIEFDYINENERNHLEKWGNDCRKIFADEYIDDKATNLKRESYWKQRLRRTQAGRGRDAAVSELAGRLIGFVLIFVFFVLWIALAKP